MPPEIPSRDLGDGQSFSMSFAAHGRVKSQAVWLRVATQPSVI